MIRALVATAMLVGCSLVGSSTAGAGELLHVAGAVVRWAAPASGAAPVITYAVLAGPYELPVDRTTLSPDNCGAMRPFAEVVAGSAGTTEEAAKRELRSAFAAWEEAANIRFVEAADTRQANIIVGASASPRGRAFANLSFRGGQSAKPVTKGLGESDPERPSRSFSTVDSETVAAIEQAYVCLNPGVRWKVGFDGELDVFDLRHTFMHEIGHAIGLDHPDSSGSIMGYRYDERTVQLQPSDIAAVQSLYGAPRQN